MQRRNSTSTRTNARRAKSQQAKPKRSKEQRARDHPPPEDAGEEIGVVEVLLYNLAGARSPTKQALAIGAAWHLAKFYALGCVFLTLISYGCFTGLTEQHCAISESIFELEVDVADLELEGVEEEEWAAQLQNQRDERVAEIFGNITESLPKVVEVPVSAYWLDVYRQAGVTLSSEYDGAFWANVRAMTVDVHFVREIYGWTMECSSVFDAFSALFWIYTFPFWLVVKGAWWVASKLLRAIWRLVWTPMKRRALEMRRSAQARMK